MRFHAEFTLVEIRGIGGNQLPQPGTDRRRFAHDVLGEACQVHGRLRAEGEEMPDLPVFPAAVLHPLNQVLISAGLGIVLYVGKIERFLLYGLHGYLLSALHWVAASVTRTACRHL